MPSSSTAPVARAASCAATPARAVAELMEKLQPADAELVVFFASPQFDRRELAEAWKAHAGETRVIGCTSAGEIGPAGYRDRSISAFALRREDFSVEVIRIDGLQEMELDLGTHAMHGAMQALRQRGCQVDPEHCFAFVLVDGLSMREEALVSSLHRPLGEIHLFGGSAGDDLDFGATQLYDQGRFASDVALAVLVHTDLPFEVFRTQHFVETESRMVITEADPLKRVVTEINAEPAAREYARAVGLEIDQLSPQIFAAHPVLVRVGGETFVRSIAKVNEDESLSFFCAIETGNVLTVARGIDLLGSLESALDEVRARVGPPELTIGCDCILRHLEAQQTPVRDQVGEVLERHRTVGFATYGEQFDAMHVNQTLTGVMIGGRRAV